MFLVLRPFSQHALSPTPIKTLVERFLFYRPDEIDIILIDLYSVIYVPSPGDYFRELGFFHASLPDFLLDRSCSKDLFLDQGAAYAKLTGLAVKHMNNPTDSPLRNNQCKCSPSCCDSIDSIKIKTMFNIYFKLFMPRLIHPRSFLTTCAD